MKRLAMIGLDSAEITFVNKLIAAGELPTLGRLKYGGARATLRAESAWRNGRVWETVLTGHPVLSSAALFDPDNYSCHQLGSRKIEPFYTRMPNLNVLALDVPYMSLWYDVPGIQAVWGGHDAGYPRASRPAGLVKEIDARFGVHPGFHNDFDCAWHHEPSINSLADALITGARRRVEIVDWLMEKNPNWNVFLTVLSEAHSAGEMFWHGADPRHPLAKTPTAPLAKQRLHEVYRELDASVGKMIARMPSDTTTVVCSVHGMEWNHYDVPSMVLLPELLYRACLGQQRLRGPDTARWRSQGCPPVMPGPQTKWQEHVQDLFEPKSARKWWRDFRSSLGLRKRKIPLEALTTPIPPECELNPEQIAEPVWPLDWQSTCWYRPYWPQMKAFALPSFYDGRVRINLRGREKHGMVDLGDFERACDWVENLLGECRNLRDGKPVVEHCERVRPEDPLNTADRDGDLIFTWNNAVDGFEHPELGVIGPIPYRRTGGHTSRGFAYFNGPGIAPSKLGVHDSEELTGTFMNLLGDSRQTSMLGSLARAA